MTITQRFTPQNFQQGADAPVSPQPYQELTDDGAITIAHGTVFLNKAGVVAATITLPPADMDGAVLSIVAMTAQAHTVTCSDGFNAGSTSTDVATFGGAIGDSMTIAAKGGEWYVLNTRNVTLA